MARILIIQVAALGHEFLLRTNRGDELCGLRFHPMESISPALTCPVQASFRTAEYPSGHGIVGNGFFSRELSRVFFWEQSARLVQGERIWDVLRRRGKKVAVLFWQQSLGEDADIILSPAPIHKHHGGLIQDCFSKPEELYRELTGRLGRPFRLEHYWGPRASVESSRWIADATCYLMNEYVPDLLLTYLPHLDYALQRNGPDSRAAVESFAELKLLIEGIITAAKASGYSIIVFGDYAMMPVRRPVFPNRALAEAGLLPVRRVRKMLYPDLYSTRAFVVADHQAAHVVLRDTQDAAAVRSMLEKLPGVSSVLNGEGKSRLGLDHPRAGDLVLLAEPDAWFAYPWWASASEAPDYATHVDIHNKPGYDPCELFRGRWPFSTSQDATRVRGSHGLAEGFPAAWASDLDLGSSVKSLPDLARRLKSIFEGKGTQ